MQSTGTMQRSSHYLIFLVFFLYKTSESLLQPSVRLCIYQTVCSLLANGSVCSHHHHHDLANSPNFQSYMTLDTENRVQAEAARYLLAYRILLNLPAVLLSLFCGNWSDRVGRVLPMLLPCFGGALAVFIFSFSLAPKVEGGMLALGVLLVGAAIYGFCGKSAVLTMACNSYITDTSDMTDRTKQLARLLGMNFFGIFLGSLLVGLFQRYTDLGLVLITVALIQGIIVVLVVFFVKESHGPDADGATLDIQTSDNPKATAHNEWLQSVYFVFRRRSGRRRAYLGLFFVGLFVNQICKSGEQDAILLYVEHRPLEWSTELYGYYLSVYYGCMGINLVVVLPLLERWLQPRDTSLILIGLVVKTCRLLATGLSERTELVFVAAVFGSAAGFIVSAMRSLISKFIDPDEVGKTFALLSCMEAASNLIGPAIFNSLYAATVSSFPGLVFVLDSCLHMCLIIIFLRVHLEMEDDLEKN